MLSGVNYIGGKVEGFYIEQRAESEYLQRLHGCDGRLFFSSLKSEGTFAFTAAIQCCGTPKSLRIDGTYKRSETNTFFSYVLKSSKTNDIILRWPKRAFLHRSIEGTRSIRFWLCEKLFIVCSWNEIQPFHLFGGNGTMTRHLNKTRPLGYFKSYLHDFLDEDDLAPLSRKYTVEKEEDEITPMKWARQIK